MEVDKTTHLTLTHSQESFLWNGRIFFLQIFHVYSTCEISQTKEMKWFDLIHSTTLGYMRHNVLNAIQFKMTIWRSAVDRKQLSQVRFTTYYDNKNKERVQKVKFKKSGDCIDIILDLDAPRPKENLPEIVIDPLALLMGNVVG